MAADAALAGPRNKTPIERSTAAPAEPPGFDGRWTIEQTTTVGNCPQLIPGAVVIQGDQIVEATGGAAAANISVAPWGYVESDGTIVARFTLPDGRVVRAHGQLRAGAGAGSGAWSSNSDYCGGSWRAQRESADRAATVSDGARGVGRFAAMRQ